MLRTLLLTFMICLLFVQRGSAVERPNVIVITVDAFRPDHLGCNGCSMLLTPTLDSLAATGVTFTNAFSSAAWTSPGLISLLTGRHEPAHGVDTREKSLSGEVPTLPGELVNAGYSAPDLCYLVGSPNYQNLRFDEFPEKHDFLTAGHEILFRWLQEYASSSEPFFLYYHYRDLHQPYDPSSPFDTLYLPGGKPPTAAEEFHRFEKVRTALLLPPGEISYEPSDTGWVNGLYAGQVAEMDHTFFRPLFSVLRKLGIGDNTLIVISADHGEELLDHGKVGHASTSLSSMLYDESIRIPLIFSWPGFFTEAHVVEEEVQISDILPTILTLLDLPIPEGVQGRLLTEALHGGIFERKTVFVSCILGGYQATKEMQGIHLRAVRTPFWKLMRRDSHSKDTTRWLFDLVNDPLEMVDVSDCNQEIADSLEALLEGWLVQCRRLYRQPLWSGGTNLMGVAIKPVLLAPQDGDRLTYETSNGRLGLELKHLGRNEYDIEYSVGTGPYFVEGAIPSSPDGVSYGPFTPTFWNTLVRYNPWKFRVLPPGRPDLATDWVTFNLEPVEED